MTGRMPSLHGVRHNGVPLDRRLNTFVDLMRVQGYKTALIGKSHLMNMTPTEPRYGKLELEEGKTPVPKTFELAVPVDHKNSFYDQGVQESEKMGLIKGEFKNNLISTFIDRKVYALTTICLYAGLPFLWGHKSNFPEYFGLYSTKALIIIILYTFTCALSLIPVIYFNRLRSYMNKSIL